MSGWSTVKHDLPKLKQQIDRLLIDYRQGHEHRRGQDPSR